ncbi:hypothetical protein B0H63DRAFT_495420 [Podospora didyma]|uniref:Fungal-type protein kinase domain-containing protein n=1 Tax=Podospora didyma TaxID=330526 RepID=A0AAE0NID0_9PEZI|nr:hypothetical protein B0H63DRAFT_495420 [Podospora didyma]
MINEDDNNPSWPSFLVYLYLAIKEKRQAVSGAKGKTDARAFMAIGALLGEQHSFMHDLESFFWVLFWICIHFNGPDEKSEVVLRSVVSRTRHIYGTITDHFTSYYEPLIPLLNRLRKVVLPNDGPWEREDEKLYSRMRDILRQGGGRT